MNGFSRFNGVLLVALVLALSGCAGNVVNMEEVAPSASPAPQAGKAMVVFMRPSGLGFAVQSTVYEVKGDDASIIGVVAAKTKVAYQVEPGQHLFMTIGESADFMSADLDAGKTYYARVAPRLGMMKARFSLDPVGRDQAASAELDKDLNDCKWVAKNAATEQWAAANMQSIRSKRTDYYADWLKKPEAERPSLLRSDGR